MPRSRSDKNRPQPHPTSRWPTGTSYEDVFDYERMLREEAESKLEDRIKSIETRQLLIDKLWLEKNKTLLEEYPELKEAYDKFKDEESKMLLIEELKKDNGNSE